MIISNQDSASDTYQQLMEGHLKEIDKSETRSKRLVRWRVVSAFLGLGMIVFGILESSLGNWVWELGILMIVGFLVLATWYEYLQWDVSVRKSQLFGYERLLARINKNWNKLKALPFESELECFHSDWTKDLDVFGERSLYRWYSLAMTLSGSKQIARWLTECPDSVEIKSRQIAVRELVPERGWRLAFFQIACGLRTQSTHPEEIGKWARSSDFFHERKWLFYLSWIGPIAAVSGIVLLLVTLGTDLQAVQIGALGLALSGVILNFLFTLTLIGPVHDIFHRIGAANRELSTLQEWIDHVSKMPSQSSILRSIKLSLLGSLVLDNSVASGGADNSHESHAKLGIKKLRVWMGLAGLQRSPLFFLPYVVLQILFLWDIRVLGGLEGWKRRFGTEVERWIESLGLLEAIVSASTISDEYPDWTSPQFSDEPIGLATKKLAHPLLADGKRVSNDVQIEESKRLLLVTGSNMAGKSTLLRSIGINSILARTGSNICCSEWHSQVFELASSIRVQDSLQDGVSFFMAELKRLRNVVDRATAISGRNDQRMVVLLDEILQGTNSRERQIAVESVLIRLLDLGAIVVASTHDLELAGNATMEKSAQIVHFREYFEELDGKQIMRFDYKMRQGVTPTTNALKLLELVGL